MKKIKIFYPTILVLLLMFSESYAFQIYSFQGSGTEEYSSSEPLDWVWNDELGDFSPIFSKTRNITASGILKISDDAFSKGSAVSKEGYDFSEIISFQVNIGGRLFDYGRTDGCGLVSQGATAIIDANKLIIDGYFIFPGFANGFVMSPEGISYVYQGTDSQSFRDVHGEWKRDNDPLPPVPEPSTIFLLGSGIVGIGIWRRRKY